MANEASKQPASGVEPKHPLSNAEADIARIATSSTEANGWSTSINPDNVGYHRSLTRRKVMMMTFGAGIGTGPGPAGLAVTYTLTAIIVSAQYCSIGEMTTYLPVHGGFIRQCSEFVNPAFGFAIGINFWFAWVMIIPAEITAAVSVLQFWPATNAIPLAAYITILLAVMALGNIFHVKVYGYIEYYMSFVKCAAVVLMICFLFIMASGGIPATHGPIIFSYWKHPGCIQLWRREHIAVIAGEVASPRSTIRKTVRPVFWRMFTFFVVNIWLVGMCVPYDDPNLINGSGTLGSPFVIALKRADLWGLAYVINGFIFLSVISCGITSVYVASRSLTALADLGIIKGTFGRKDGPGRPWVAIAVTLAIGGGLCYLNVDGTGSAVYGWFSSLVAIATLFQWASIYIAHLRFRNGHRAPGKNLADLPFNGLSYALACFPFGGKGSAKSFFSTYLAAPLFFFDYGVYKWWFKTRIVKPSEMDFSLRWSLMRWNEQIE
ncbi:amino acid permease-domain-containing protein [Aspergillus desertorum]